MKKSTSLYVLILLIFAGCNSISPQVTEDAKLLWDNPTEIPEYISGIYFGEGTMCADISLTYFVEVSQTASVDAIQLADFASNLDYSLNESPVSPSIGGNRHNLLSCLDIDNLPIGTHKITLLSSGLDDRVSEYSWAFKINSNIANLSRDEMLDNVELPDFPE